MGGAVAAIEQGFMQDEIEQAAYEYTKAVDDNEKVIVGVNKYVEDSPEPGDVFPIDPALQASQIASVQSVRASRDQAGVDAALAELRSAAGGAQNLLPPMKEALRRLATLGEVSDVLREQFGVYRPAR
jgi:methylmalonyl-CoA mutase, N-terminal domain